MYYRVAVDNEAINPAHVISNDGRYSYVAMNTGSDPQNVKNAQHIYELDEHPEPLYELDEHIYELDWAPYNEFDI